MTRQNFTIFNQENEIDDLKNQTSNLRKLLRSALKEIKTSETVIDSKNNQLAEYEAKITSLKKRIKELSSHKKKSSNQIEMASSPRSPRVQDVRYDSFQNRTISHNFKQLH